MRQEALQPATKAFLEEDPNVEGVQSHKADGEIISAHVGQKRYHAAVVEQQSKSI